jgi:hypothetical protein
LFSAVGFPQLGNLLEARLCSVLVQRAQAAINRAEAANNITHVSLLVLQEFINFFFLQRAATATADGGDDWRLHGQASGWLG